MAYVQVDVDLDEFSTDELCSELSRRLKSTRTSKQLSPNQIAILRAEVEDLADALNLTVACLPCKSLDDKIKLEAVCSVWNKFNSQQFEQRLLA